MGPPPAPMMQQGGFAVQPTTVYGVPLEPGERVIYFHNASKMGSAVVTLVLGFVFIMFFIGIFLIIAGLMMLFSSPWAYVMTTRRLITIKRGRTIKQATSYYEIQHITNTIRRYSHPSGPRTEPGYWMSTSNIALRTARSGTINIGASEVAMTMFMPLLVKCMEMPGYAERAPSVPFDP
jgi:hypothetical protein